jgi:hypothetical protein
LGGPELIKVWSFFDGSHATGPKARSITGSLIKLNEHAGAISAKSTAQATIKLCSFETELDFLTTGFKNSDRVMYILSQLNLLDDPVIAMRNDNLSMLNFVKGDGAAKGVRHMELRMWYCRDQFKKGRYDLEHMDGKILPADKLTKLGNVAEHRQFTMDILGLKLTDFEYFPT